MDYIVPSSALSSLGLIMAEISEHLNVLFEYDVIERLNRSLLNVVQAEDGEDDIKNYIQALLSRYELGGRPLNGYFLGRGPVGHVSSGSLSVTNTRLS